jgi:hypothetical protein
MAPEMETPRCTGAAVSGTFQATKLERPEYRLKRRHRQSLYRERPAVACMVRYAVLKAGGEVRP